MSQRESAADAYRAAAQKFHGEFAHEGPATLAYGP